MNIRYPKIWRNANLKGDADDALTSKSKSRNSEGETPINLSRRARPTAVEMHTTVTHWRTVILLQHLTIAPYGVVCLSVYPYKYKLKV